MADRYWVGGSGTWDNTLTTNWSATSGGAAGASAPTSADNVFFDANSGFIAGSRFVTSTTAYCLSMDWTGSLNNPTLYLAYQLEVYGATCKFIAGMTVSGGGSLNFQSTSVTTTLTTNGVTIGGNVLTSGAILSLADALTIGTSSNYYFYFNQASGTLNTNNFAISVGHFSASGTSSGRTLNLGSSTITLTGGSSAWDLTATSGFTLNEGTSTIVLSGSSPTFTGNSETYYNVILTPSGSTTTTVTGSNTFNTLTLSAGKSIAFTAGTTQTITALSATGTAGNIITLRSTVAGSAFTFSDTAGTNTCNFLDIKDCTASGGATWRPGDSSVNSGNNTGWSQPWTDPTNAYSSNNIYATHTATDGDIFVQLSKDAGTTWQTALLKTFTGVEGELTYGLGAAELWGTSWTGADMDDVSFKLRVISQASGSFNTQVFGGFAFDAEIAQARILSGIEVKIEAKWDGTTTSIDAISVRAYSSGSAVAVVEGSLAYATDTDGLSVYDGTSWYAQIPEHGWVGSGETWTYASADAPTFVITVPSDATIKYSVGMRIRLVQTTTKYFIITAVSATTLTVYGGTDYTLANATISSPAYSMVKAPVGFPLDPTKWTSEFSDTTRRQLAAGAGIWHNTGSLLLAIPIGVWRTYYQGTLFVETASGTSINARSTLSTANNTESDVDMTCFVQMEAGSAALVHRSHVYREKVLVIASKTTYYLNMQSVGSANISGFANDLGKLFIRAVSAYL